MGRNNNLSIAPNRVKEDRVNSEKLNGHLMKLT